MHLGLVGGGGLEHPGLVVGGLSRRGARGGAQPLGAPKLQGPQCCHPSAQAAGTWHRPGRHVSLWATGACLCVHDSACLDYAAVARYAPGCPSSPSHSLVSHDDGDGYSGLHLGALVLHPTPS